MKTQMIILPEEIRAADSPRIPVTIIPEIMEITVRSAGMAMADAIISHHVLSSTALLSQDLSERELCAL